VTDIVVHVVFLAWQARRAAAARMIGPRTGLQTATLAKASGRGDDFQAPQSTQPPAREIAGIGPCHEAIA
jgi:hypothetical protein